MESHSMEERNEEILLLIRNTVEACRSVSSSLHIRLEKIRAGRVHNNRDLALAHEPVLSRVAAAEFCDSRASSHTARLREVVCKFCLD